MKEYAVKLNINNKINGYYKGKTFAYKLYCSDN